jgi:phage replication-related protein YjqB (UPF0714/DUF867 family)
VAEGSHRHELLYDDDENDGVLVCAAHGGDVEPGTSEAAIELATALSAASCWACLGYCEEGDAFDRYHPASTAFDPAEYPLLGEIADRGFETVISLHGLADEGLIVGGATAAETKALVAERLDDAVTPAARIADGGPYGGVHPDNFVNWLAADDQGGLQIEMGPTVRSEESEDVVAVLEELVSQNRL